MNIHTSPVAPRANASGVSAAQQPAAGGRSANRRLFPVYRFVGGIGTTLAYFFDDLGQHDFLVGRLDGFADPIKLYGAPSTNVERVVEVDRANRWWDGRALAKARGQ